MGKIAKVFTDVVWALIIIASVCSVLMIALLITEARP